MNPSIDIGRFNLLNLISRILKLISMIDTDTGYVADFMSVIYKGMKKGGILFVQCHVHDGRQLKRSCHCLRHDSSEQRS